MSDLDRPIYRSNQASEIERKAYVKGRKDAIDEYISVLQKQLSAYEKNFDLLKMLIEQLKENRDECIHHS